MIGIISREISVAELEKSNGTHRTSRRPGLIGFVIIGVCCTAAVAAYRATHRFRIVWDERDQSDGDDN
jgi:hypothetical protein